ncbi:uncharacterized protein [Palaemon carinicauda]|uniref:uncharacterized protein n=1 Tax=Palaemon carinicauda TaxID=392227 RepID=UPI0035B58B5F
MANLRLILAVWLTFVAVASSVPANTSDCPDVNCSAICDRRSDDFKPQKCSSCNCPTGGAEDSSLTGVKLTEERLDALESSLFVLKTMTGVLLAVVLLLLLAFVLLFLYRMENPLLKFKRVLFCKKKGNAATKEQSGNMPTSIGRLADHQSDSSPQLRRPAESSPSTLGDTSLEPQPRSFRTRQPSESTCPEEDNDITPGGYDNFGLSTSTIDTNGVHNTSLDTIGSQVSANTMQTTLPSMNHLPSNRPINTKI